MTKKKSKQTEIICDGCGKSCCKPISKDGKVTTNEFMRLEAFWGYASKKDLEKWTANLCEKCVDEKLSFIKFKKQEYHFFTGEVIKISKK